MTKPEIESLTGLRFIASMWVLMYHIGEVLLKNLFHDFWVLYYKPLFHGGAMGVDLFFVLSGFVIAYNYFDRFASTEKSNYLDFLFKRFARIYPVHLATLLLLIPIGLVMAGDALFFGNLVDLLKNLFLLQAIVPPAAWNIVSWSISCEWLAYSFFPILVLLFSKLHTGRQMLTALVVLYTISLALFAGFAISKFPFTHPIYWILRIACEFTAGVLIFKIWQVRGDRSFSQWFKRLLVPILTLVIFLLSHIPIAFVIVVPFLFLTVYLIATDQYFLNKFLARPAVTYGGRISYSLYMVHGMTMLAFHRYMTIGELATTGMIVKIGYILLYVVLTFILTVAFYHWVEEPARKALLTLKFKRANQ
ncbi:MAG: acyltransferase [Pseudomonadales bacterium]|nr:acyltransferase [Pseudomonadales bacterium]